MVRIFCQFFVSPLQQVELAMWAHLLWLIHKPVNIVSDSANVVGLFLAIYSYCAHSNLPGFISEVKLMH